MKGFNTIKNVVIMKSGKYNGITYNAIEIEKAFKETNWNKARNIFYDFEDDTISKWIGYAKYLHCKNGVVTCDVTYLKSVPVEEYISAKLTIGMSPKVKGNITKGKVMKDFVFINISLCINPSHGIYL
jgi:hypothetical protein